MRNVRRAAFAGGVAVALTAMTAGGATTEQGEAGDLVATAQPLGAVSAVDGSLSPDDVDLYRVCVGDQGFAASTVGGTGLDTVLYVFDGDGRGVAKNDDASGTFASEVVLPSAPTGTYHVAVTGFGRVAVTTAGALVFGRSSSGGVLDPEAVLGGWRDPHYQSGAYRLVLSGAVECVPAAEAPVPLLLDVLPGSESAVVNARSKGRTPMALLGIDGLDLEALAAGTIVVGPAEATPVAVHLADVDGDGYGDLVLHVPTQELGLAPGPHELCATATPAQGAAVRGCEAIEVR